MPVEINFMIAGEAGQGIQSVGHILCKTFARSGYHIFADQDYESRVRGGHNFFRVRVSKERIGAIMEPVDILIALNQESIDLHQKELWSSGITIYDNDKIADTGAGNFLAVPLEKIAEEKSGNKLMANTVALGAALGLTGCGLEVLGEVLHEYFDSAVAEENIQAAGAGYQYVQDKHKKDTHHLVPADNVKRMLINGNEAISLGAIAAGCKFMSAYPMTPASSIMEYIATKSKDFDLVMVHAEDEIAAVNMAIGASYAGVRAMTATSGSGFCLMVEGLGMAGITETPVVIIDAQRPGPAVGLPTRTEQGDLQFVLHAHHSEFPRAVLAPATVADAFWVTVKAFNLAEKYQLPVIILTDQHLASSYATVDRFDLSGVTIDRGLRVSQEEADQPEYQRHKITMSGISPRAFPGEGKALVVTDSDEHDETGHMIEDAQMRTAQVQKRMRKLFELKNEFEPPQLYGPKRAGTTLIGWGSTYGALHEAVDLLRREQRDVNLLHLNDLWPFPAEAVADALDKAKHSYVIENNATGQLSRLIKMETGRTVSGQILKYDGRPFTPAYIVDIVNEECC